MNQLDDTWNFPTEPKCSKTSSILYLRKESLAENAEWESHT